MNCEERRSAVLLCWLGDIVWGRHRPGGWCVHGQEVRGEPGACCTVSGNPSAARSGLRSNRGEPLLVLLRRAVYGGLPYPHRRAAIHQEDCTGKFARVVADYSRCEYIGRELRASLSSGRVMRRRVRIPSLQQAADRDRAIAAARDGCVLAGWRGTGAEGGERTTGAGCVHRGRARVTEFRSRDADAGISRNGV